MAAGPERAVGAAPAPRHERRILAAIVVGAVALRLFRLGSLSLAGDEEITTLAALALLDGWPPALPGGLSYLRGLPFTVLEAGSIGLVGWSEWSVRLLPALLAGPRVAAMWWLARPLLGGSLALAGAALLAVAPADVEMSRVARMYSLLLTLDVLLLAALVHAAAGSARSGVAGAAGVLAIATHRLALTHAPVAIAAALGSGLRRGARLRLLGVAAAMGLAYLLVAQVLEWAHRGIGVPAGAPLPEAPRFAGFTPVEAHGLRMREAVEAGGWAVGLGGIVALVLAVRGVPRLRGALARLAGAGSVAACLAASPVLGATALLLLAPLGGRPLAVALRDGWAVLAACAVASLAWLAGSCVGAESLAAGLEQAARLLLGFPAPNWYELAAAAPGLVALGGVGLVVAADRGGRAARSGPWLVLIAAVLAPALVAGVGARAEHLRYLTPAIAPLIVAALLGAAALLAPWLRDRRVCLAAAVLLTALALRPDQALRAVLRVHGPLEEPFAARIAPDHRGAAAFLRDHALAQDWIAAEDPLQQRLQAGRSEVWLRRLEDAARFLRADPDGGTPRDVYVGALHAHDLDALRRLAAQHGRRVVWLVTSGEVEAAPEFYRTPETRAALEAFQPLAWFVGADGATRVYQLVDGEPVAPVARRR